MKQSFSIGTVVALQLLATLLTQLLVIRIVGVGPDTDAYIAAQAVPAVLVAIVTTALQSVWLPRLAVLSDNVAAWRQEQSIAQSQAGLLGGGLVLLVGVSIPWWLPLLYPGLNAQQHQSAMGFCLVMLLAAVFITQSALLTVALRARKRFLAAEFIALLGTLLSLVAVYLTLPKLGLSVVVWIALARAIMVYAAQMSLANWPPLSFSKAWSCKETWILMRPLLFGSLVYKSSPIVDSFFASLGKFGDITIFSLSQIIVGGLSTITEKSVGVRLSVEIIENLKNKNRKPLINFHKVTIVIMSMAVILSVISFMLSKICPEKIGILIGGDREDGSTLLMLLMALTPVYVVSSLGAALSSFYYFHKNTKTPVVIGVIGHVTGICLKGAGYYYGGMVGLALASSLNSVANMLVNYIVIRNNYV